MPWYVITVWGCKYRIIGSASFWANLHISSMSTVTSGEMLINVVLGVHQGFNFFGCRIKGQSTLIIQVGDSPITTSRVNKPLFDGIKCLLHGSKFLDDLFRGPVLAVV